MNSFARIVFLIYFITHIPITLVLDLQVIFGQYYPPVLQALCQWYINTYNDNLIRTQPIWLKSFIWCEFFVQMPFFFYATYALLYKKNSIRIPAIVYGTHVATTVLPILSEFMFSNFNTVAERNMLFAFYLPYLIIPLWLALYMCFNEKPFGDKKNKTK